MLDREYLDQLEQQYIELAWRIRNNEFSCVRAEYALTLAHSFRIAHCAGVNKITIIELGVAGGRGLEDLCHIAEQYREMFNIDFEVVGFDIATGMPNAIDYRDHPEIWHPGQFDVHSETDDLRQRIEARGAQLIIGNVAETIPKFISEFNGVIGFVSIDLDHYSGTRDSMPLFNMPPENYLPAVPVYVDDMNTGITYNPWCGEHAAIEEYNQANTLRKIEEKHVLWGIQNFHVLHLFDHPARTGAKKIPYPLDYGPF